jgi:Sulfotransferase family
MPDVHVDPAVTDARGEVRTAPESPPILIGGLPRSGTTMMGRLLGSHSEIAIPPTELGFFDRMFGPEFARREPLHGREDFERRLRHLYARKLHEWSLDEVELLESSRAVEATWRGLFVFVLDRYRLHVGKSRFGEKTTTYERWFDVLDSWFDDYRFVHLIRNPIDMVASKKWYEGRPQEVDLLPWIHEWNRSATIALHRAHREPRRYCYVRYEDLVGDSEPALRRICDVVGIDFEPGMVAMGDYESTENSSFAGVAQERRYNLGVRVADDVDRRSLLDAAELDAIVSLCGPLAYLLGYELGSLKWRRGSLGRLPRGRLPIRLAAGFVLERARERVARIAARA